MTPPHVTPDRVTQSMAPAAQAVLALSGGVGGAKLSLGLERVVGGERLTVLINTGDDFWHLGLRICPDIDTTLYTLAGLSHPEQGWGRAEESFGVLAELTRLGFESWFRLGDRDLALHLERTRRLQQDESLTAVTAALACALGVRARLWPMCDAPVATRVRTAQGWLGFQDYFVRERCVPAVTALAYAGVESAAAPAGVAPLLASGELRAIVVCPSNPWLSIDPVLAVPGLRAQLRAAGVPIVAVSPLIAGRAVKGPTAKLMTELGLQVGHAAIAAHYADFIDGLVVDEGDADEWAASAASSLPSVRVKFAPTLMQSVADRERLAQQVLAFADELREDAVVRCEGGL